MGVHMGNENNKQQTFASDTSNRTMKEWIIGLIVLFIGLTIAHLGVTLFVLSNLGIDTFTIFVQGISETVGLTIGTCHVIILIALMIIMLITTKGYIKPGSVVCAFCGGWIIDFFMWVFKDLVTDSSTFVFRFIVMILGCIILSFGMSIVIESHSGTGPNDLIAIILTDKLQPILHLQFRWVRIICDVFFIVVGVLLGGTFGIGTIAAAFLTGPIVQFFLPISRKIISKIYNK